MTVMASLLLKVYRTLAHTRFTTVASLALRAHALSGGFTVRPSPYLRPQAPSTSRPPAPTSARRRSRLITVIARQTSCSCQYECHLSASRCTLLQTFSVQVVADAVLGVWRASGIRAGAAWRRFPYLLSLVLRLYFMVEGEGWCRLCPAILSLIGV